MGVTSLKKWGKKNTKISNILVFSIGHQDMSQSLCSGEDHPQQISSDCFRSSPSWVERIQYHFLSLPFKFQNLFKYLKIMVNFPAHDLSIHSMKGVE